MTDDRQPAPRFHEHHEEGLRPIPDPTLLTMEALRRDIGALADVIKARLDGIEALMAERKEHTKERFDVQERERVTALNALTEQFRLQGVRQESEVEAIRRELTALRERLTGLAASIGSPT